MLVFVIKISDRRAESWASGPSHFSCRWRGKQKTDGEVQLAECKLQLRYGSTFNYQRRILIYLLNKVKGLLIAMEG